MESAYQLLENEYVQKALEPNLDYNFNDFNISASYFQAGMILFLIFVLLMSFARIKNLQQKWSMKGATSMIFIGFIIALVLEGFLLLGGRTVLTEFIGWENAPKPISTALDEGRQRMIMVLGVTDEIPSSSAAEPLTADEVMYIIEALPQEEKDLLQNTMCTQ